MSEREQRLEALGFPLDRVAPEGKLVDPLSVVGRIVYVSGQVAMDVDMLVSKGKVPDQISVADATKAAALCAANALRVVRRHFGSLDRVERILRITGYVNSSPEFTDQHLVINGASQLVRDVFGEAGRHARTALGMAQLPLGTSVEVEMIVEMKE
jgi:enamine deaminase RidA (YjgF/YER057c/UK114 family)